MPFHKGMWLGIKFFFEFIQKLDKEDSLKLWFKVESHEISNNCFLCVILKPVISVTALLKRSDIHFLLLFSFVINIAPHMI